MAIYPEARRVLLTAYATPSGDTSDQHARINYYLTKPWIRRRRSFIRIERSAGRLAGGLPACF